MKFHRGMLVASFFPIRLTQWFGPLFAAGGLAAILGILIASSGMLDLSASKPHPAGWASFLHYVFERSTAHHARGIVVPHDIGSDRLALKGATYYQGACSHCHGGPGLGQNPVALSMRPQPQYLVNVVNQWSDAQLFWILKHGVKYSAMPAWPAQDRDDEVWALVSFIRRLPKLSTAQYRTMAMGDAPTAAGGVPSRDDVFRRHGYLLGNREDLPHSDHSYTSPAAGFDDMASIGDLTKTCSRCHGPDGTGRAGAGFPNITLLSRTTFLTALRGFARGTRHSAYMQNVATQLTDRQISALADLYTGHPRPGPQPPAPPADVMKLGEAIAVVGIPAKRVGACQNCHQIAKSAATRVFPSINGQSAPYLRDQMRIFASGARSNAAMYAEAHPLSERETDAVSLYYASLAPEQPRVPVAAPAGLRRRPTALKVIPPR